MVNRCEEWHLEYLDADPWGSWGSMGFDDFFWVTSGILRLIRGDEV